VKIPESGPEFVLQRPGKALILTELLETNFWGRSNIVLEIPLTRFSSYGLVWPHEPAFPDFDPLRYGNTLSAVGSGNASKLHTK